MGAAYGITAREGEVVALVCQGLTNQEIADRLFVSLKTVTGHNYSIFRKTGVRNRVEVVNLISTRDAGSRPDGRARVATS